MGQRTFALQVSPFVIILLLLVYCILWQMLALSCVCDPDSFPLPYESKICHPATLSHLTVPFHQQSYSPT